MNLRLIAKGSCLLAVAALIALPHAPSRAASPPGSVVPGELLVGVRPESDGRLQAARLTTTFGAAVAVHPELHTYVYHVRPGVSLDAAIAQLKAMPGVLYAEPNHILHAAATPNDSLYASQWGPQKVQAD